MLNDEMIAFLRKNHSAAMVTVRQNGMPHTARCNVALVDGKLWSTCQGNRVRLKHVRANPKVALAIFAEDGTGQWLGIEGTARLLEGDPHQYVRFQQALADRPIDPDVALKKAIEENRTIFEFDIQRTYGRYV